MMASTVADNMSTSRAPLAANPGRNPLRLRARTPMIASAYRYGCRSRRQGRQGPVAAGHGSARQSELVGEPHDLVEPLLGPALLVFSIAVKRDSASRRLVRPETLALELDIQLLVEQPPPERHRLAGQLGPDFVGRALDRDSGIAGDAAALGLACESAEPLPRAHRAHAVGRQVLQPILDPAVRLAAMVAVIVGNERPAQPEI